MHISQFFMLCCVGAKGTKKPSFVQNNVAIHNRFVNGMFFFAFIIIEELWVQRYYKKGIANAMGTN